MAPKSRPKRARRTYTTADKTKALELYEAEGPSAVHKTLGIPKSTVTRWAKEQGIGTVRNKKTEAATKASEIDAAAVRAEASNHAIQGTNEAFKILHEKIVAEGREMAAKDLATVAGIMADKHVALTKANEGTQQHNDVDAYLNFIMGGGAP